MAEVKERILKQSRGKKKKKRVHIEGNPNKAMSCFFLQKLCRPEENDMICLKC